MPCSLTMTDRRQFELPFFRKKVPPSILVPLMSFKKLPYQVGNQRLWSLILINSFRWNSIEPLVNHWIYPEKKVLPVRNFPGFVTSVIFLQPNAKSFSSFTFSFFIKKLNFCSSRLLTTFTRQSANIELFKMIVIGDGLPKFQSFLLSKSSRISIQHTAVCARSHFNLSKSEHRCFHVIDYCEEACLSSFS